MVYELPMATARLMPQQEALKSGSVSCSYGALAARIEAFADGLAAAGLVRQGRVAVYADKSIDLVAAMFGAACAGGVMVPVNPLLKPEQVGYILRDCNVAVLVTTAPRLASLAQVLPACTDLQHVVLLGPKVASPDVSVPVQEFESFISPPAGGGREERRLLPREHRRRPACRAPTSVAPG